MRPGQNDLERDIAAKAHLPRVVDDSHSTPAQLTQDLIASDLRRIDGRSIPCPAGGPKYAGARPTAAPMDREGAGGSSSSRRSESADSDDIQDAPGALQMGQGFETDRLRRIRRTRSPTDVPGDRRSGSSGASGCPPSLSCTLDMRRSKTACMCRHMAVPIEHDTLLTVLAHTMRSFPK